MGPRGSLPLIVVSVGTDHHPFDRLLRWMDSWAGENRDVRVIIQRGTTGATTSAESQPLVPHAELCDLFATSTVAVTHGGPSTVMDVRAAGRLPVVVPRDPGRGEHVDDHQLRFAAHIDREGLARIVYDLPSLTVALTDGLSDPARYSVSVDESEPAGVLGFGRVVDELLGGPEPAPSALSSVPQARLIDSPDSAGHARRTDDRRHAPPEHR